MTAINSLLAKISGEVGAVRKDGFNSGQKFNFRGIDQVVNACHKAFADNQVTCVPHLVSAEYVDVLIGHKKNPGLSIRVVVDYVFTGPEGDSITARVAAEGQDMADKGTAKAMSVAMRTALLQALMLPTDDVDPDAIWEEQQTAPPAYVQLRADVIEKLKAKEVPPEEAAEQFASIGGVGKVSECEDVALLKDFLDTLDAA